MPDVELLTVGMEWPAGSGAVTLTLEDMHTFIDAAADEHIRPARVKLGHSRLQPTADGLAHFGDGDPTWDGEPAFGTVGNLRLTNDGSTLVGDLVEVPEWLAEALPSHWPSRSCEFIWDHTTTAGKKYPVVLTAVALLGTVRPAIADLEDLQRLITEGPQLEDPMTTLSVDAQTIARRFNNEWAGIVDHEGQDTYWWWARSVRVDPNELIADDGYGHLFAIPFTTDGEDDVTFDEPVRVRETYVPVAAAVQMSKPDKQPRQEGPRVNLTTLRAEFGIDDTITDTEIRDVLTTLAAEETTKPDTEPDTDSNDGDTETADTEPVEPESQPAAAEADPRDTELAGLRAELTALRATADRLSADNIARTERETSQRRERILMDAMSSGRINKHERDTIWAPFITADEQAATERLSQLPANHHPVVELGHTQDADTTEAAYPSGWLSPSERARIDQHKGA